MHQAVFADDPDKKPSANIPYVGNNVFSCSEQLQCQHLNFLMGYLVQSIST
jgi:hypothetical protein